MTRVPERVRWILLVGSARSTVHSESVTGGYSQFHIMLTFSTRRRSKQRNNHLHNGGRLTVGVVIPVFARSQGDVVRLMEALNKLSQQTRQPDYVILVDDGSPLAIPSIIRCVVGNPAGRCRHIRGQGSGPCVSWFGVDSRRLEQRRMHDRHLQCTIVLPFLQPILPRLVLCCSGSCLRVDAIPASRQRCPATVAHTADPSSAGPAETTPPVAPAVPQRQPADCHPDGRQLRARCSAQRRHLGRQTVGREAGLLHRRRLPAGGQSDLSRIRARGRVRVRVRVARAVHHC